MENLKLEIALEVGRQQKANANLAIAEQRHQQLKLVEKIYEELKNEEEINDIDEVVFVKLNKIHQETYVYLNEIAGLEITDNLLDFLTESAPFVYRVSNKDDELLEYIIKPNELKSFLKSDYNGEYLNYCDPKEILKTLCFVEGSIRKLKVDYIKFYNVLEL